jgi:autotransporter-associated beta strand protein
VTIGTAGTSDTVANATGLGTLSIGDVGAPTNANVQIGNNTTTNVSNGAVLDMSGLSTFYANLGTGTFRIGDPTNSNGSATKASSVILAGDSTILATTISQDSPDAGQTQLLRLGSGTNTLAANTIHIGANANGRTSGTLNFNSGTGTVSIRSFADPVNGRATLNVANVTFGTGSAQSGTFDVSGHTADLRFGTVTVASRSASTGAATGTFSFDTGSLDANDLLTGNKTVGNTGPGTTAGTVNLGGGTAAFNSVNGPMALGANASATGTASGTLNVSGGAVTVAANGGNAIRLGNATLAGGTATGLVNITGGSLTVAGNIVRGATTGTSNATVTLNGGTLDMGGNNIGAAGAGLVTFDAQSGTLQNLAQLNGGGTLTKTTAGVLTMAGTNAYTGITDIQAGEIKAGSTTGLSGGSVYSVAASSILSLNGFSSHVGGLSGAGTVQNASATAANLILGANNGSPSVSGVVIQDGTGGGALSLIKQGTGTATISGTNTFTGKTTVAAGTLSIASVDATATANQQLGTHTDLDLGVAATSSGTLLYTGAAGTLGKNINALGNGTDTIQNGGTGLLTLTGTLTKSGTTLTLDGGVNGIAVSGSGTIFGSAPASDLIVTGLVTLASANTFNGPAIVSSGATLNINHAGAIPTALTINGGTLDNPSGAAITLTGNPALNINSDFTFTGSNNLNLGTGAVTLNANRTVTVNGSTLTIGGAIAGNFNLTGAGAGTLLLTGASTYTGTTTVSAGSTITAGGNGSLGDTSSGTTITTGGALVINNINYSDPEPLSLNGTGVGGTGALVGGNGTSTFAGPITIATNSTIGSGGGTFNLTGGIDKTGTVVTFAGGGTFNIGGAITGNTGSPNSDLVVNATTVNLNAANTYNGPTFIQNVGVLNANVANALPTANGRTAIIMNNATGNVLNLGVSQSIASLTGGANDAVTLGANNLTIGAASGSTVFAGSISGTGGSLTKDLASTLTLDQAASYTGGTTVNGGTLNVRNTSGSATGTGDVTVGASGTLSGTGSIAPNANNSIYINGSFVVGDATAGSPVASTFGLSTSGAGSTVMGAGSSMSFDLFTGAGLGDNSGFASAADFVNLTGSLDLTAAATLIITNPTGMSGFALGDKWKLFSFVAGSFNGTFASINDSALSLGVGLYGSVTTDGGGAYYVITNVPEPTRALLLMLGLLGIGMRRRRRAVA